MNVSRAQLVACLGAVAVGAMGVADANAAGTPLAVTGFNVDFVVEVGATGPDFVDEADAFDFVNNFAYQEVGVNGVTFGMPVGGTIVSDAAFGGSNTVFQVADYTRDNALGLTTNNPNGTLTLVTPTALNSISILAVSASGAGNPAVVITFDDATTLTTDIGAPDWFFASGGTTPGGNDFDHAIEGLGRTGLGDTITQDNGTNPDLYETVIDLSGQTVVSLAFTFDGSSGDTQNGIFAVSGDVVPEPGSLALLGLGGLALLRRRR